MAISWDRLKAVRDFQVSEMNYHRSYRWQIFAWSAGLLLGGTSVVFALSPKAPSSANATLAFSLPTWLHYIGSQLFMPQKLLLVLAIVVLCGITLAWLAYHHARENQAKQIINQLDQHADFNFYQGLPFPQKTALTPSLAMLSWTIVAVLFLGVFASLLVLSIAP